MTTEPNTTATTTTAAATTTATAAPDWRAALPEDMRADESLSKFKGIGDLAKSYKEAQSLIGRKRLELPRDDWKPEQHDEFWKTLGRPDAPDAYAPTAKSDNFEMDETQLGEAKKVFHQAGLTTKQGQAILDYYVNSVGGQVGQQMEAQKQAAAQAEADLKAKWGDNYDIRLATARHFTKQFASPELLQHLTNTGLGNDPRLVEMLYNMSKLKAEDNSGGAGLPAGSMAMTAESAKSKIESLKADKEFTRKLFNRNEPGHDGAKELWNGLHRQMTAV